MSKLVRDRTADQMIERDGADAVYTASALELDPLLRSTLMEHAAAYAGMGELEELADLLEVVRAIADQRGVSFSRIEALRVERRIERGGFDRRCVRAI